jgi:hypothetical protein
VQATIKWQKATDRNGTVSEYGLVSDDDRFRIGKYVIPAGTVYQAFDGHALIGRYDSGKAAQQACQEAKIATPVSIEIDKKSPAD